MSQIVKIAVNSLKGDDLIGGHTGKARKFWIYTITDDVITNKELLQLLPEKTIHNLLHGMPDPNHPLHEVDAVICGGIGAGAVRKLNNIGIEVFITTEENVNKAIDMLIDGTLPVVGSEQGHGCDCGGHDHDHNHEHEHHHHH